MGKYEWWILSCPKWDPQLVGNAGLETEEPADMEAMRREIEETDWR